VVRSELIQKPSKEHPSLPLKTAEAIMYVMFGTMLTTLARGNRVELRGFGSFMPQTRSARMSRNPRTGEAISVAEKRSLISEPVGPYWSAWTVKAFETPFAKICIGLRKRLWAWPRASLQQDYNLHDV